MSVELADMLPAPEGFELAGGVMWCHVHHGVADECSSHPEKCDMSSFSPTACDLRELWFRSEVPA